jgi:predicted kinase
MREPFKKFVKEKLNDGFLLITCGLPGTGKSRAAKNVQQIKGGKLLRTDVIRREVLKNQDIFDAKVAGDMKKRTQVYDAMFKMADEAFKDNKNVILDATFLTQALRQRAAAIAAKHNVAFVILQTDWPPEVALKYILARDKGNSVSNALTEAAYLDNKKKFEPVDLDDLKKQHPTLKIIHLVVDTVPDQSGERYITQYVKK